MSFVLILAIVMAVGLVALSMADQRKMWRRVRARWLPNAEAREPSDAVVTGLRLFFVAWAALLLFAGCQAQEAKDRTDRIGQETGSPYGS
ncbi:hypothetical protein ABZV77_09905 [Streptomyces sp. NPDC004732]|uniref:hypothetical protein n=1 Tax=Streptomyces sp. NPDC004732 TaxID=3154290 RepID=UPI0033A4F6A5